MSCPEKYRNARPSDFDPAMFGGTVPRFPESFLLAGPTGTGKTHMAWALWHHWGQKGTGITCAILAINYQSALTGKYEMTAADMIDTFCGAAVLILDDLGTTATDDRTVSMILAILTEREARALPTIVTTNLSKAQLDPRLADRLGAMRTVAFTGKSRRQEFANRAPFDPTTDPPIIPDWLRRAEPVVRRWMEMSMAERVEADALSRSDKLKYTEKPRWRLQEWALSSLEPHRLHTCANLIHDTLTAATLAAERNAQEGRAA